MAHWIIEDKGFGGVVYTCSNCRETWNDYYSKFPKDYCCWCGENIDEDANEYIEELNKGCSVCGSDYNQEIICTIVRYHTSETTSSKIIETKFCPNCGRRLGK